MKIHLQIHVTMKSEEMISAEDAAKGIIEDWKLFADDLEYYTVTSVSADVSDYAHIIRPLEE